jgi:hypothetical protein
MKFGYISIEVIIDEAAGELKRLNRQGMYSRDDAYMQAVECATLLCGHNYEDATVAIEIRNHNGVLPLGFVSANDVWQCEETSADTDPFSIPDAFKCGVRTFAAKAPMFPTNSAGIAPIMNRIRKPAPFPGAETYLFKKPPGIIRTSFKTGWVGLHYNHLLVGEDGFVMVQDEPNMIRAIKNYVKKMHMQDDYYSGKLNGQIWQDVNNEYDKYEDLAKTIQKAPGNDEMHKLEYLINSRYWRFKIS